MKKQFFPLFALSFVFAISIFGVFLVFANSPLTQATNWLLEQKGESGVIGDSLSSDWAVMALSSAGISIPQETRGYLLQTTAQIDFSRATEIERKILAVTSFGGSPYNVGGENLVERLQAAVRDGQIGNIRLLNDDIFGILALVAAGKKDDSLVSQSVQFLASQQNNDGGFSFRVGAISDLDDTAAAIWALRAAGGSSSVQNRALTFLKNNQNPDGGFPNLPGGPSNVSSTAWVASAFFSLGIEPSLALQYLEGKQREDGSFPNLEGENPQITTTAYAIIALSKRFLPTNIYQPPSSPPSLLPDRDEQSNKPSEPAAIPSFPIQRNQPEEIIPQNSEKENGQVKREEDTAREEIKTNESTKLTSPKGIAPSSLTKSKSPVRKRARKIIQTAPKETVKEEEAHSCRAEAWASTSVGNGQVKAEAQAQVICR